MPHTIDEELFANWQHTFASRIGREQIPHAQVADYRALCRIFDSDADYHAAAQHVYEHWASWNAWPAPIEFESARATLRHRKGWQIAETAKLLTAEEQRCLPSPKRSDAIEAFATDWRTTLRATGADPRTDGLARIRAILARPDDGPWQHARGVGPVLPAFQRAMPDGAPMPSLDDILGHAD